MHLKILILFCILACVINTATRRIEDGYVMIGSSNAEVQNSQLIPEEKGHRYGGEGLGGHPLFLYAKPEYSVGHYGSHPAAFRPPQGLVSSHIHLLEPFMLLTFLAFVLSLLEKVKFNGFHRRNDRIKELNATEPERYNHHFLKMLDGNDSTFLTP